MTTIIRVGLIGLSGASPSDWEGTNWASSGHLPYLTSTPHYKIVALLNRSVESAEAAIAKYKLPSSTKAYGDPEDLAKDPDIDLVVCSTRVDRHFQTVRPSIIAGKSVFVEWPLERNLNVAKEVTALAKEHNSKTIIGLQGSFSPLMRKLKQTIESGRIGKILSSSQFGVLDTMGGSESRNSGYFLDREVGGNILSIHFGHTVEFVQFVLGSFKSFDSLLAIRRPTIDIVDPNADNKVLVKDAKNTNPDQILFHGTHEPSNAVTTLHLTGGQQFPGTPPIEWRIRGENGEIRITSPSWSLSIGNPEAKAELFEYGKEGNENVELLVPDRDDFDELPTAAQNIARLYEAYWKGEWHPDFEWAVKRHDLVEEMWRRFDETSG